MIVKANVPFFSRSMAYHQLVCTSVADPGEGRGGHAPLPGPVKISHKKDGHQRQPHIYVSRSPLPGH